MGIKAMKPALLPSAPFQPNSPSRNTSFASSPTEVVSISPSVDESPPSDSLKGNHDKPITEFPEGGARAWATVVGAVLLQFCGFGYSTSYGIYQDYYTRVYIKQSSPSTVSWIGSVNTFLVISFGLVAGRLYDRGYFYHLILGGSLLISFSLFMLSLALPESLYQCFLAQGVGLGIGGGMVYVPSVAVVSHYFRRRLASVMMFAVSGSALGAIVHPIMLNNLLNHTNLGFGGSIRASAGLVTGLLVVACALIRTRLPPPKELPSIRGLFAKSAREVPFAIMALSLLVFAVGFFFPLFYIQLNAIHHGLSKEFSFYALVILNTSSFFGRLVPGFFVRRLGVVNSVIIAALSSTALVFAMIGLRTVASVVIIATLVGFFLGMFIALQAPLVAVLTVDPAELGARMGIAFTFSAIGALIGPPINGALLSSDYIWWRPATFSGVCSFLGGVGFIAIALHLRKDGTSENAAPMEKADP
ncbi:monocarboxylate permease [Coprinopsis cinerea AmutBmut pab1-1]|nr:monocarboxylate permease [Coprinopsis cinerea AmutBmut pab1-1]